MEELLHVPFHRLVRLCQQPANDFICRSTEFRSEYARLHWEEIFDILLKFEEYHDSVIGQEKQQFMSVLVKHWYRLVRPYFPADYVFETPAMGNLMASNGEIPYFDRLQADFQQSYIWNAIAYNQVILMDWFVDRINPFFVGRYDVLTKLTSALYQLSKNQSGYDALLFAARFFIENSSVLTVYFPQYSHDLKVFRHLYEFDPLTPGDLSDYMFPLLVKTKNVEIFDFLFDRFFFTQDEALQYALFMNRKSIIDELIGKPGSSMDTRAMIAVYENNMEDLQYYVQSYELDLDTLKQLMKIYKRKEMIYWLKFYSWNVSLP